MDRHYGAVAWCLDSIHKVAGSIPDGENFFFSISLLFEINAILPCLHSLSPHLNLQKCPFRSLICIPLGQRYLCACVLVFPRSLLPHKHRYSEAINRCVCRRRMDNRCPSLREQQPRGMTYSLWMSSESLEASFVV